MTLSRAICISSDRSVCGVIEQTLEAAGLRVEHVEEIPGSADIAVVVVDRRARQALGVRLRTLTAPVIVVGDDLDDDSLISLMLERPVSHLVEDPRDRDLTITSQKLVSGDVFGLEKYVATGVEVHQRVIRGDADKRHAMDEVCSWAEAVGARRPVVHRLQNVVDELVMNALYDLPDEAESADPTEAVLRWASDEQVIAISVADRSGTLRQRDVIDNVRRARIERGRPQPRGADQRGAGLGLYLVLANVASLVINISPGRRTEIVCLFDLARRTQRGVASGARSFHVFGAT